LAYESEREKAGDCPAESEVPRDVLKGKYGAIRRRMYDMLERTPSPDAVGVGVARMALARISVSEAEILHRERGMSSEAFVGIEGKDDVNEGENAVGADSRKVERSKG